MGADGLSEEDYRRGVDKAEVACSWVSGGTREPEIFRA